MLPCKHTFCEACITSWVADQKKLSCPVCRKPIDGKPPRGDGRPPGGSGLHAPPGGGGQPPCTVEEEDEAGSSQQHQEERTDDTGYPLSAAYSQPYAGYRDRRYRQRGYTHQDLLRDELLFRMLMMRRRERGGG